MLKGLEWGYIFRLLQRLLGRHQYEASILAKERERSYQSAGGEYARGAATDCGWKVAIFLCKFWIIWLKECLHTICFQNINCKHPFDQTSYLSDTCDKKHIWFLCLTLFFLQGPLQNHSQLRHETKANVQQCQQQQIYSETILPSVCLCFFIYCIYEAFICLIYSELSGLRLYHAWRDWISNKILQTIILNKLKY